MRRIKWSHIVLVSLATVSMFYTPITIGEYRFDLRAIPISFLALIHGPSYAVPALLFASTWRWMIGGSGAIPGIIFGLMLPCFLSLLFYRLKFVKTFNYIEVFFLFSSLWIVSDLPIIFFVPSGWEVFKHIGFFRFVSFHFGASLLYFFIRLGFNHLHLMKKLQFYADHDPLTHLYNMRRFAEVVNSKNSNARRHIAMIDIDFFKTINDTYGHQNGDEVLKVLAHIIKELAPEQMTAGRYGGEEFIACISSSNEEMAIELLNRLRTTIEQHAFLAVDGKVISRITVSIGVAPFDQHIGIEKAIEHADKCLYIAKQTGRNRVVSHRNISSYKR